MTDRTILILGANGRLGAAATTAFAAAGWSVVAHMRRPPKTPLPAGARALHHPLQDIEGMVRHAGGASVVLHAINPPMADWDTVAISALRQGMDIAQSLDACFMLPGNVYGFGEHMPPLLSEDTPQRPTTRLGQIRLAMESEMEERARQGLRSVVLRAGDFFGAGSGSWFDQALVKSLAKGRLVYPGPMDQAHAWAYLPDLAQAFVALAEKPATSAGCEHLHYTGFTLTGRQLLTALEAAAKTLGAVPADGLTVSTFPWRLIRWGSVVVPTWRSLVAMSYLWRVPHALDGRALQRRLGLLPQTPLLEALRRTLVALGHGTVVEASALTV